jgi:hypothetical protein
MKAGKLLGLLAAAALLASAAAATEWKVVKQNGRDYVSFANLAEFYHFGEYSQANRAISLRSERRGILAHARRTKSASTASSSTPSTRSRWRTARTSSPPSTSAKSSSLSSARAG